MRQNKWVTLQRDCEALLIPSAVPVSIPSGTNVHIVQQLGGNFTLSVNGNLVRIDGANADALGLEIENTLPDTEGLEQQTATEQASLDKIWAELKTCYDPEIPVNIVDLGLIYSCKINWDPKAKRNDVNIIMTLTAPGCGMGPVLISDIEEKVKKIPQVTHVQVELVFDPPWDRSMMAESAQLELGML